MGLALLMGVFTSQSLSKDHYSEDGKGNFRGRVFVAIGLSAGTFGSELELISMQNNNANLFLI